MLINLTVKARVEKEFPFSLNPSTYQLMHRYERVIPYYVLFKARSSPK